MIDRLPITIIDGSRGLHTAEVPVASSLDPGLSFRSLLSLGGRTGKAPWISLRTSLITELYESADAFRFAGGCRTR